MVYCGYKLYYIERWRYGLVIFYSFDTFYYGHNHDEHSIFDNV